MAVALGRNVLLLQEGDIRQPIDYRQIVKSYQRPSDIPGQLQPLLRGTIVHLQERAAPSVPVVPGLLERLDLGDVAAENESRQLRSYFVRTGPFYQARRGHARLVIGRKGSGKTAIFYALRDSFRGRGDLVLDLKPEGHQFLKLKEAILDALTPGMQMHTLTAFWNYIRIRLAGDSSTNTGINSRNGLGTLEVPNGNGAVSCIGSIGASPLRVTIPAWVGRS